jgi:hypothetical protein
MLRNRANAFGGVRFASTLARASAAKPASGCNCVDRPRGDVPLGGKALVSTALNRGIVLDRDGGALTMYLTARPRGKALPSRYGDLRCFSRLAD